MDFTPTHWWAVFGILLIVLEIFTTTFFLLFLGIAAIIVAVLRYLTPLDSFWQEVIIFSTVGFAGIFVFRSKLMQAFNKGGKDVNIDRSRILTLSHAVVAGKMGKVDYQGSTWTAINDSATDMNIGDQVQIVNTDGNKLILRPR